MKFLPDDPSRDIPAMMHKLADEIGDETRSIVSVRVLRDGTVEVYGWGRTDDLHAIGSLSRAIHLLNDAS